MLSLLWRWFFGETSTANITTLAEIQTWSDSFSENRRELEETVTGEEGGETFQVDSEINDKVSMYQCDITCLKVDGIVRSTNPSLDSSEGISGAIGKAAGTNLMREIKTLNGCCLGKAVTTKGYLLPAKYIVHTVGPHSEDDQMLESCYRECLKQMRVMSMKSLAFCCISAGHAGYPLEKAVVVAIKSVRKWLEELKREGLMDEIDRIIFCLYSDVDTAIYNYWMQVFFPCPPEQVEAVNEPIVTGRSVLLESLRTDNNMPRILEPLPGFVELTYEPCMITLDDDSTTPRAKMPCGHVIGTTAMTDYCKDLIRRGRFRFPCANPSCSQVWEYFLVRHVACLTEEEMQNFEKRLAENFLNKEKGIQKCPGCQVSCYRPPGARNCVRCPMCTKSRGRRYDFCWSCLNEWKRYTSLFSCGNPGCDGKDKRIEILVGCKMKIINGKECPSIRGCPKCGMLIEHKNKCAHVECTNCPGFGFCFLCLREKRNGRWNCRPYWVSCPVAPRQLTLPGTQ